MWGGCSCLGVFEEQFRIRLLCADVSSPAPAAGWRCCTPCVCNFKYYVTTRADNLIYEGRGGGTGVVVGLADRTCYVTRLGGYFAVCTGWQPFRSARRMGMGRDDNPYFFVNRSAVLSGTRRNYPRQRERKRMPTRNNKLAPMCCSGRIGPHCAPRPSGPDQHDCE